MRPADVQVNDVRALTSASCVAKAVLISGLRAANHGMCAAARLCGRAECLGHARPAARLTQPRNHKPSVKGHAVPNDVAPAGRVLAGMQVKLHPRRRQESLGGHAPARTTRQHTARLLSRRPFTNVPTKRLSAMSNVISNAAHEASLDQLDV